MSIKAQRLEDTLAVLRKNSDFRPLNRDDAYAFMNKYYLPRLDSMQTERKIFIHPITGIDFKDLYNRDSIELEEEFTGDTLVKKPHVYFAKPPGLFDKNLTWDSKKLVKTLIIKDYSLLNIETRENNNFSADSFKTWKRKYGYGYMCVSFPQYNAQTKRMVIREWVENGSFCGACRDKRFWFTRTVSGWKVESQLWFSKNL